MSYTGRVQNGVVVLPPGVPFQEGQQVEVIPVPAISEADFVLHEVASIPAKARDWPDDLAVNHDYYLYGVSKREPRRGRWIAADLEQRNLTETEAAEIAAKLQVLAQETESLPADLAANHDYYLHGLPKI